MSKDSQAAALKTGLAKLKAGQKMPDFIATDGTRGYISLLQGECRALLKEIKHPHTAEEETPETLTYDKEVVVETYDEFGQEDSEQAELQATILRLAEELKTMTEEKDLAAQKALDLGEALAAAQKALDHYASKINWSQLDYDPIPTWQYDGGHNQPWRMAETAQKKFKD